MQETKPRMIQNMLNDDFLIDDDFSIVKHARNGLM
jgi:hypothetical protein